jgi:D-alanine-D-alanine ligase
MAEERDRIRIAVVYGGRSGEHEVSCLSAASIVANLDRERYDVVPMGIRTDGAWVVGADTPQVRETPSKALPALTAGPANGTAAESLVAAVSALREVDVAFPALHGRYGEDGTIQAMLEYVGVPYVGNGVLASTVGMDKEYTKKIIQADGLRICPDVVLRAGQDDVAPADRERLGLPVFVKPATGGSSLGVSKVTDWADLPAAVREARATEACTGDEKVLVEAAVRGREVDVAVLEYPDGRVVAGPPLEIRVTDEHTFFDYQAKYRDAETIFEIPARLDERVILLLQTRAVEVFRAMECAGLLRVDFFLPEGEEEPVVNEINTFPGFTMASQYPQIWRTAGLDYAALVDVLVATALARRGRPAGEGTGELPGLARAAALGPAGPGAAGPGAAASGAAGSGVAAGSTG